MVTSGRGGMLNALPGIVLLKLYFLINVVYANYRTMNRTEKLFSLGQSCLFTRKRKNILPELTIAGNSRLEMVNHLGTYIKMNMKKYC
jgi:hypothetical protein